ncbi:MAG: hypothetical protein IPJ20_24105 [Flammeovirgaceae bacterium]|nr:hypothetical protein [Flammeovirgaceae bacterium]
MSGLLLTWDFFCDFALKCIPPENVINPGNFYQEAQAIKIAEHPNIIHVSETGALMTVGFTSRWNILKNGSLEDEAKGAYVALTRAKKLMIDVLGDLSMLIQGDWFTETSSQQIS